jgi:hypothetical protein
MKLKYSTVNGRVITEDHVNYKRYEIDILNSEITLQAHRVKKIFEGEIVDAKKL